MNREIENTRKIVCPTCGKWLLIVDNSTRGKIYPYCKTCKSNVPVVLIPKMKNTG